MTTRLAGYRWISLGGVVMLGGGVAWGDWPMPPEDIQEQVIAFDGMDPAAEVVRMGLHEVVRVTQPQRLYEVRELATKDRGYVLSGNLFGTGTFFALYEPKIGQQNWLPDARAGGVRGWGNEVARPVENVDRLAPAG